MKIGIIVHSHTGNTYSVAQELKGKLEAAGHSVGLESVTAADEDQADARRVRLTGKPEISSYDALILGAPVRGFSLSPAMTAYLNQLGSLANKKVACFLTEFFPSPVMGGNQAMKQMKELCAKKGTEACETGIINWSNINRKRRIAELVERLDNMFRQNI